MIDVTAMARLIAVGEVLLDVVAPAVEGRVAHVPVSVRAGGVPVNAALAAVRAGAEAAVAGRVGRDAAAAAIEHALAAAGVRSLLRADEALPTGTFVRVGDAIVADRGASAALTADDVPEPLTADAVVVSGYALLHVDTRPAARVALERADAPQVAVVAPAAPLLSRVGPDAFHELVRGATALFLNEEEAHLLTGATAGQACADLGRRYELTCVTAGAAGAYACRHGERARARAGPPPADATGAGDALAGTLLALLAGGAGLEASLAAACAAVGR